MESASDSEPIIDNLISGVQRAMILRALVTTGLPDLMEPSGSDAASLATAIGAPRDTTTRLLRAAVAIGLCENSSGDEYRLSKAGEFLRKEHPSDSAGWASLMTDPWMVLPWASLAEAVLSGRAAFPLVHGVGFWEYVGTHPEEAGSFDAAMTSGAAGRARDLRQAIEMKGQVTIVDVGGGQGLLVAELLRHLPQAQGVVQDRAEVLASSPAEVLRFADRLELRDGDFFNGVPEIGDVYLLSRILHDWPDEQAEAILRSCRRSMPEGACLCVLEQAVPEADALTDDERIALSIKDLNMLVLVGGKERTLEAYRNLLKATGFSLSAVHHGESCDVVVAAPV